MKVIIVLTLLTLSSCVFDDCEKIYLSSQDKLWLSVYSEKDTLVFENDVYKDTFVVAFVSNYFSDCNKVEYGKFQYEKGVIKVKHITSNVRDIKYNCGFSIKLSKEQQKDSSQFCSKVFNVFDFYSKTFNNIDSELHTKRSTYKFEQSQKQSNKPCSKSIKSFEWNKERGLLSYTLSSGDKFNLKE